MKHVHSLFILLCFLSFSLRASFLDEARALMEEAEYQKALQVLGAHLENAAHSNEERATLYWLQSICFISLDKHEAAKASMRKHLMLAPDHDLHSSASPKITHLVDETRRELLQDGSFRKLFAPIFGQSLSSDGQSLHIHFQISNKILATVVSKANFFVRKAGNSEYLSLELNPNPSQAGHFEGTLPLSYFSHNPESPKLEYYAIFYSSEDVELCDVGSELLPLSFAKGNQGLNLSQEISTPYTVSSLPAWPFWVSALVAVTGGIILTSVLLSQKQDANLRVIIHKTG